MTSTKSNPIPLTERIEILDVLRGLAVCGILVGNVQWFSGYGMMPPVLAAQTPLYDQVTHFLVHFLIEGKFYSIFSFLFGFGFAMQLARAEERGDALGTPADDAELDRILATDEASADSAEDLRRVENARPDTDPDDC